jgi:competence protein ComEC
MDFIIALVLLWKRFTHRRIMLLLSAICTSIVTLHLVELNQAKTELVIFQKSRNTLIGIVHGKKMTLLQLDSLSYKSSYPIKNYLVSKHIDEIKEQTLPGIFNYGGNTFLIIDSLGVYPKSKNIDYILLSNNPKVNLQRLVDSLDPVLIVADGSNYYSYVKRWETTCEKAQIPFHHTKEKGAFVLTKNPN